MKHIPLIALATLAACANPRAPENPNSVPNVQQYMIDLRQSGPHIAVSGGMFTGPVAGQLTAFVATSDDALICTFQTAPDPTRTGLTATVTGYRLNVAGIYAGLSSILLPNTPPAAFDDTPNFTIETGIATATSTVQIGRSDPRFDRLMAFFAANPTPCWTFG